MTAPAQRRQFVIEREFAAPRAAVLQGWADPEAQRAGSDCHAGRTTHHRLGSGVHGHEPLRLAHAGGRLQQVGKVIFDIAPGRRIVFACAIRVDGRALSVSPVQVALSPTRGGTGA